MRTKSDELKNEELDLLDGQDDVDNKLELLKYATKVLSRGLKKDITPDFVMARFNMEKDKEAIIEMTNNAYFCKRTLDTLTKKPRWIWNNNNKEWILRKQNQKEKDAIYEITNKMFDTFMTRMSMTAILNRNVKNNHILRLIAGLDTEEEIDKAQAEEKEISRIEALYNKIRGQKTAEVEE